MMAEQGRKYLIKDFDGNEQGPYSQKELVQMAEAGELSRGWMLRSEMVQNWRKLENVDFLAGKLPLSEAEQKQANKERKRLEIEGEWTQTKNEIFEFTPAPLFLRLAAGCTDLLLLSLYALVLVAAMTGLSKTTLSATAAFYLGFTLFFLGCVVYLTWAVAYYAQTVGQWYWGTLVVCKDEGKPVLMGRAFVFGLVEIFSGWSTWFWVYILPSKRALHDVISGTRVVRIRNISNL